MNKECNRMKTRQKIRRGIILVSFFLFPATFYYLSPVLIVEASSNGIINGSFIVFLFLFLGSFFLGRGYCGWVCPAAGCQESIFPVRSRQVIKGGYIKWVIWVPWIITIIILGLESGGYHQVDFLFRTNHGLSVSDLPSFLAYILVLFLLIVLPAFLFGKRSFCHHICWMAPFMILGRKMSKHLHFSALRLKSNSEICKHCHTCSENCPMSLPVEEMVNRNKMENKECILCGTCVDGCEQGAIKYDWGKI